MYNPDNYTNSKIIKISERQLSIYLTGRLYSNLFITYKNKMGCKGTKI